MVRLTVCDLAGRDIVKLVNEVREAGDQTIQFIPEDKLKPGIYYYRLETKNEVLTRKMVFIR
jgi:hypothetical protein